jgi:SAM-dependent methyltransferase
MAQELIQRFVRDLTRAIELPEPVVEFGSLKVEAGQPNDLRSLFHGREFVGTDMREGPGVDRLEDLRSLRFADGEVGTALCLDTLEHCEDPPLACRELRRVTAPGGVCVISSVMLFPIHDYPGDYFRFTPRGLRSLLCGFDEVAAVGVGDPLLPVQVVGVGAVGRALGLALEELPSLAEAQRGWEEAPGLRVGPLRLPLREAAKGLARALPGAARDRVSARRRP